MTPQDALSQEWTTLQTQHEQYEVGGLIIKLASVALTVAGFALHLNLKLMLALVALLWLQEGIYRTFQSRLGRRILRVEQLIKRGAHESDSMAPAQTTPMQQQDAASGPAQGLTHPVAFQLHSEWVAGRPGVVGLIAEYARSACRPTVAFPHAVLMIGLAFLRYR